MTSNGSHADSNAESHDIIIIGAGFAGLYALHRLRLEGFSIRVLEAAPDIGGTWYWNAYPGARCDVESMDYSYSFSPELDQEWTWSELYPAQPEILRYINHVADRFDLRSGIELNTTVSSATFDEEGAAWDLQTDDGRRYRARFCVFATGNLSAPLKPRFEGVDDFDGESYTTGRWPHSPIELAGKRVAVIGTGSSAVQLVPGIASEVSKLKVLQRTAIFSVPGRNRPLGDDEVQERKANYPEYREKQKRSAVGVIVPENPKSALEMSPDEQRAELDRCWDYGGCGVFNGVFADTILNLESNEVVQEYVREKIREKVNDPNLAEKLCPTGYPFAAKRLCVDNGYFETFNRDNVELVDVSSDPIRRIVPGGIELTSGDVHEVDVIIYAIGYDAISGPMLRIDVRGRGGVPLREAWALEPKSYLGVAIAGFPNLFSITGPGSPSVLAVMIAAIEQHVDWVADLLVHARDNGYDCIEATADAQSEWWAGVQAIANATLFPLADSWYMGANVPGKPRILPVYLGGLGNFRAQCDQIAADGYTGFSLSASTPDEIGVS